MSASSEKGSEIEVAAEAAARAMTRLNKLRVGSSVSQQRWLAEAKDYLAEVLDELQAVQDRAEDQEGCLHG